MLSDCVGVTDLGQLCTYCISTLLKLPILRLQSILTPFPSMPNPPSPIRRYFALPCLENLLEAPNGSFADVYAQQSSALEAYIAAQPFQVRLAGTGDLAGWQLSTDWSHMRQLSTIWTHRQHQ